MSNQKKWLEALTAKLWEIDDPNPEVLRHDTYEWSLTNLKGIGFIPKISFSPHGRDTQKKAEIMRNAGLVQKQDWKEKKARIAKEKGLKLADDKEDRQLARTFNKLSIGYWSKVRSAILLLQEAQMRFCKDGETLSVPVQLIIADILPGFQRDSESEPIFKEFG